MIIISSLQMLVCFKTLSSHKRWISLIPWIRSNETKIAFYWTIFFFPYVLLSLRPCGCSKFPVSILGRILHNGYRDLKSRKAADQRHCCRAKSGLVNSAGIAMPRCRRCRGNRERIGTRKRTSTVRSCEIEKSSPTAS